MCCESRTARAEWPAAPANCFRWKSAALSSTEWLDAGADRVGDLVLGDDADHVRRPGPASIPDDDRHDSVAMRQPLNDVEHDIALARDGEIPLRDVAETNTAIGLLAAAARAGIDLHHARDVIAARPHHSSQSLFLAVLAKECIEMCVGGEQRYVLLHDVARPAYQEHVGVQRL